MKYSPQICIFCLLMVSLGVLATPAEPQKVSRQDSLDQFDTSIVDDGKVYMVSKTAQPFRMDKAEAMCRGFGGFLLELDTNEELRFVRIFLRNRDWWKRSDLDSVFTGYLGPNKDGSYIHQETKHQLKLNSAWDKNQPKNITGEDCVIFQPNGKLRTTNCRDSFRYVCEVDLVNKAVISGIHRGKMYTLSKVKVPFGILEASQTCKLSNGTLLELDDFLEVWFIMLFLRDVGLERNEKIYTGANDLLEKGNYIQFDSRKPLKVKSWATGRPRNWGQTCVRVDGHGDLYDSSCKEYSRFICEVELDYDFISSRLSNNSRYYHISGRKVVFDLGRADAKCGSLGGYLLELNSLSEAIFVKNFIKAVTRGIQDEDTVYTGINDVEERGTFVHKHSGKEMQLSGAWDSRQPDLETDSERCVVLRTNGKLATYGCGLELRYICEVESP